MKRLGAGLVALTVLVAVACGPDSGSKPAPRPGIDFTCDATKDRIGTYLLHYQERAGGTCGAQQDSLVRLESSGAVMAPGGTCALTVAPTVSNGGCTLTNTIDCTHADGNAESGTAETTQQDDSGSVITGVYDVTIFTPDGATLCSSLYDMTYTRQ